MSSRFDLLRQSHFRQKFDKGTRQVLLCNPITLTISTKMLLNKLEEPHQHILLHQAQALIFKDGSTRIRHIHQIPTLIAEEARIDRLELHILISTRSQYRIDGLVRAEQHPWSSQVQIELPRVLLERLGRKGGNLHVGVERSEVDPRGGEIAASGRGGRVRRGRTGAEEAGEVIRGEGSEVGAVEGVGVEV